MTSERNQTPHRSHTVHWSRGSEDCGALSRFRPGLDTDLGFLPQLALWESITNGPTQQEHRPNREEAGNRQHRDGVDVQVMCTGDGTKRVGDFCGRKICLLQNTAMRHKRGRFDHDFDFSI